MSLRCWEDYLNPASCLPERMAQDAEWAAQMAMAERLREHPVANEAPLFDMSDDLPWGKLRILRLRTVLGMTQRELADAIHVHRSAVQWWESGQSTPRPHSIRALIELERKAFA